MVDFFTADICDELGDGVQVLDYGFHSFGGKSKFSGKIETIRLDEDNTDLIALLKEDGKGRVCVVDVLGKYVAVVGENLMKLAVQNHWSGLVINGYVRDIALTREIDAGLIALGTCPKRSSKKSSGQRGIAVKFGGVIFEPDNMLYADEDGVIVVNEL